MNEGRQAKTAADVDDAAVVAMSLQRDFERLIAIFDRQLGNASSASDRKSLAVCSARAAAKRGLKLSEELAELLRSISVRV